MSLPIRGLTSKDGCKKNRKKYNIFHFSLKNSHSYPVIFQKTDIFAMFEREKIDFSKSDFVRFP